MTIRQRSGANNRYLLTTGPTSGPTLGSGAPGALNPGQTKPDLKGALAPLGVEVIDTDTGTDTGTDTDTGTGTGTGTDTHTGTDTATGTGVVTIELTIPVDLPAIDHFLRRSGHHVLDLRPVLA